LKKDLLRKTHFGTNGPQRSYQAAKSAEGELETVLSRFNVRLSSKRNRRKPFPMFEKHKLCVAQGRFILPIDGRGGERFRQKI